MPTRQRSSTWWGVLATLAVHGLLLGVWQVSAWQKRRASPPEVRAPALQVRMLPLQRPLPPAPAQPLPPRPHRAATAAGAPPPPATAPQTSAATEPARESLYYYFPEEVERELMLRRDPAADQPIDLPHPVILDLFVDARGRMNAVTVDDPDLDPALQEQLRAAFMQLEFLPALRGGAPVAARMRIEVASGDGAAGEARAAGPASDGASRPPAR